MYLILCEGQIIDGCTEPHYVTLETENGCPQQTTRDKADAISVNSVLYNLEGMDKIPGAKVAVASKKDDAREIFKSMMGIDTLKETTQTYEDMLLDLDAMYADQVSALEDTILDLDAQLNGDAE